MGKKETYAMVHPDAESLMDKIAVENVVDIDKAVESINANISQLQKDIEELRKQKIRLLSEKIFKSLEEGKYYRVGSNSCKYYLFKYTKDNVSLVDMTGTVGHSDGDIVINIRQGISCYLTRTQYHVTFFNGDNFMLSDFSKYSIEETDKEQYLNFYKEIIDQANKIKE